MAKVTKLLFGVHMHQPVDNFKEAVDEAVFKCYKPLFKTIKRFEKIKMALHCSGWLLEYIKKNHKDLFSDIKELSDRGSIEFFTAGYYEPILSCIPKKDRIEQIKKLNTLIKKEFSQTPKGVWLTERVWETSLVEDLSLLNLEYIMVDDYHFLISGFGKDDLEGYYFTEFDGEKIALFPINKELRYAIPFKNVEDAVNDIKKLECAIVFDDAEKFGLWPKTYERVYAQGWLEEFLKAVEEDEDIQSVSFGDYYSENNSLGLAYLQNASYQEMGEWSLKTLDALRLEQMREIIEKNYPEDAVRFVKGGIWKNFFIKYEESNRLHKRMIEVSKYDLNNSDYRDNLYRLQTNDVFWHGVFGGLYLPNLRDNAYSYLCKCENIKYKDTASIEIRDGDLNGYDEIKCVTDDIVAIFDSHYGGQLIELLQRDRCFNYQNVLTRREESYHEKILKCENFDNNDVKEGEIESIHDLKTEISKEIKESLNFDWYVKNSFIDHISDDSFTLESFKKCSFWEYGDFANQPFKLLVDKDRITFYREGGIYFEKKYDTDLIKSYVCKKNSIEFEIDLKTQADKEYRYVLEFNLHFADLKNVGLYDMTLDKDISISSKNRFDLRDGYTRKNLNFSVDSRFDLFVTPLKSVSQSEKGFDLMTQGVSLALVFVLNKELKIRGKLEIDDV